MQDVFYMLRGLIALILGVVILLGSFGYFPNAMQAFNLITSVFLIAYGLFESRILSLVVQKVTELIDKK